MVGGQVMDMDQTGWEQVDLETLYMIHKYKTGALIKSSARIGAILAGAGEEEQAAVSEYASELGLCFQIVDDVLNATSTRDAGQERGSDAEQGKATFVGAYGLEGARSEAGRCSRGPSRLSVGWTATPRDCGTSPSSCATERADSQVKDAPQRLDALLVERGLAENRSRAQGLILAGSVRVGGQVVTKAGLRVAPGEPLTVETKGRLRLSRRREAGRRSGRVRCRWKSGHVSMSAPRRAVHRCAPAAGRGAVLAVDVGYGQLAWPLRNDERVVMERTNVRHLTGDDLPFAPISWSPTSLYLPHRRAGEALLHHAVAAGGCRAGQAPVRGGSRAGWAWRTGARSAGSCGCDPARRRVLRRAGVRGPRRGARPGRRAPGREPGVPAAWCEERKRPGGRASGRWSRVGERLDPQKIRRVAIVVKPGLSEGYFERLVAALEKGGGDR